MWFLFEFTENASGGGEEEMEIDDGPHTYFETGLSGSPNYSTCKVPMQSFSHQMHQE